MRKILIVFLFVIYQGEIYSQDQDSKPPLEGTPVAQTGPDDIEQYEKYLLKTSISKFYEQLEGRREDCKEWMGGEAIDTDFISLSLQYSLTDATRANCKTCKNGKMITQLHPEKLICIFKDKKLQDLILDNIINNKVFYKYFPDLGADDLVFIKDFYTKIIKDLRTHGP